MTIGWLIVLFAAAIALLIVGSNAYYRAITRRMHAKLDDITAIYENGRPTWRDDGAWEAADVRRLSRLITYLKTTRLVVDEETRKEVLERLQEVRNEWSQRAKENGTGSN